MNFAPYQDSPPEHDRALSPPPPTSPRRIASPPPRLSSPRTHAEYVAGEYEDNVGTDMEQRRGAFGGIGRGEERDISVFATSLPLRLDYEACLAYLLLPPAGSALLLVLEHKSDYVRFHAWQASLVFTVLFAVHVIISFSRVASLFLLGCDLVLMAVLTTKAYRDADTLDRFQVPILGRFASNFVDEE